MSITRRPDESRADFLQRRDEENDAAKSVKHHVRQLIDSRTALGITQAGIDGARMRKTKYDIASAGIKAMSKTQLKAAGLLKKKPGKKQVGVDK